LYDLEVDTGATRIKIWFDRRKVGLDVGFSRVSPENLVAILDADEARVEKTRAECDRDEWKRKLHWLESIPNPPARVIADIESLKTLRDQAPLILETKRFREESGQSLRSGPSLRDIVKGRAIPTCQDGDGRIPLLDFRHLVVHHSGRKFVIRDGIQTEGFSLGSGFLAGGFSIAFGG